MRAWAAIIICQTWAVPAIAQVPSCPQPQPPECLTSEATFTSLDSQRACKEKQLEYVEAFYTHYACVAGWMIAKQDIGQRQLDIAKHRYDAANDYFQCRVNMLEPCNRP